MSRAIKIDQLVLQALSAAEITGASVRLTGQLDRPLYAAVNKVLEAAGGKWSRKAKAHVFDGTDDAASVLEPIILTGEYSRTKQDFGVFYTPPKLAQDAALALHIGPGMRVLEPEAGAGALAIAARDLGAQVNCFDILPKHVVELRALGFHAECADFLEEEPEHHQTYHRVLMNPPFAGQADIHHVNHAIKFLQPGGRLVAIMSAGVLFRQNALTVAFNETILRKGRGNITPLPADSFKESGTSVNTALVTYNKPRD